jgi:hypothetical protein
MHNHFTISHLKSTNEWSVCGCLLSVEATILHISKRVNSLQKLRKLQITLYKEASLQLMGSVAIK